MQVCHTAQLGHSKISLIQFTLTFLALVGGDAKGFAPAGEGSRGVRSEGGAVLWMSHEGGLCARSLSCSWLGSLKDLSLEWDGLNWVGFGLWLRVMPSSDSPAEFCFENWVWVLVAIGNGAASFKIDWLSCSGSVSAHKWLKWLVHNYNDTLIHLYKQEITIWVWGGTST